ncbi:MAG: PHP domain-containing protein [Chloroflexi bacterium]|nr:PHP domain-containing protein [Chloroflexota bacterium]
MISQNLSTFRADLHVHTVLSPCAAIEMIPPIIVAEALDRGIDVIAITDHNHSANIAAVQQAARGTSLTVLPGMELQTKEEVHVLCLFDTLDQITALQQVVDAHMPGLKNNPEFFGEQFVVDASGDFIRREEQLLLISCELTMNEASGIVDELGGLFIPAHVDRVKFGLLPVLGLLPTDITFPALEISRHLNPESAREQYPQLCSHTLIQNGDVHFQHDFLGSSCYTLTEASIDEIRQALSGKNGRNIEIKP